MQNVIIAATLVALAGVVGADRHKVIVHFDAEGVASDGIAYRNSYAWILRMEDGRVTRAWAFFDALAFDALWTRVNPG